MPQRSLNTTNPQCLAGLIWSEVGVNRVIDGNDTGITCPPPLLFDEYDSYCPGLAWALWSGLTASITVGAVSP